MDQVIFQKIVTRVANSATAAWGLTLGPTNLDSLADAATLTGDPRYLPLPGQTWVYYARENLPGYRDLLMGSRFMLEHGIAFPKLQDGYVLVGRVSESSPSKVFGMMQGERWSPKGEARRMIRELGLHHTSMSVGDVMVTNRRILMVDHMGFFDVKARTPA